MKDYKPSKVPMARTIQSSAVKQEMTFIDNRKSNPALKYIRENNPVLQRQLSYKKSIIDYYHASKLLTFPIDIFKMSEMQARLSEVILDPRVFEFEAVEEYIRIGGDSPLKDVFISLDDDQIRKLYMYGTEPSDKINVSKLENDFYVKSGITIKQAVDDAIARLDVGGSLPFDYSRHDFQPASRGIENMQIQLGGSKLDYRRGKGDTSCTNVVVDSDLFLLMRTRDTERWKKVIQEAHRISFLRKVKVIIMPYPGTEY
ncbi:hypothetical protein [Parabacteroides faecis]|uniref:hypothetical protein n=1 Tax=Parabacteroides faecis TaxID=1217282 RepID=UPI00352089E4